MGSSGTAEALLYFEKIRGAGGSGTPVSLMKS